MGTESSKPKPLLGAMRYGLSPWESTDERFIILRNLSEPLDVGRRFDISLCIGAGSISPETQRSPSTLRSRRRSWELDAVEPWYRQNMFVARLDATLAGNEPRIPPVFHTAMMMDYIMLLEKPMQRRQAKQLREIAGGSMPASRYPATLALAIWAKVRRALGKRRP